ncbi:MAG: PIN domain-containing protein [Proteobacteria bacterium]|nr:PIN domain-containing protein [Pseudomonadota bacterium]
MSRYCLDTSAYSRFKSGHEALAERIDTAEWVGVPSVVLGELWVGFLGGRHIERNAAELARFLANPAVHEIPVQREVARLYAEILVDLRRAGTPVPTNDIWIAASAAHAGATVLTADRHFAAIQRVGSIVIDGP